MSQTLQSVTYKAEAQTLLTDLIQVSQLYGQDIEFVIAGGGNTSCKDKNTLYVKASGFSLGTISEEGFVMMDRMALQFLLDSKLPEDPDKREAEFKKAIMAARCEADKGQRPSVECVIHHLIPATFVVHTHSTWVNMITCCKDAESKCRELFSEEEVLWIPYVDPGYTLAKEVLTRLEDWQKKFEKPYPSAIFMKNHGLIVSGESPQEVQEETDSLVDRIKSKVELPSASIESHDPAKLRVLAPVLRAAVSDSDTLPIVRYFNNETVQAFLSSKEGKQMATAGPLTPDQIVYCTSFPLWLEGLDLENEESLVEQVKTAIQRHVDSYRFLPKIILVPGVGAFSVGNTAADAETTALVYQDAIKVMLGADALTGVNTMGDRERLFIEDWEVEAYRKKISAAKGGSGRMSGKVAIVTGAAQGFGLEISQFLAAEGAHVVLTDINEDGASKAAKELCAQNGKLRAAGAPVNVMDGESLRSMIDKVILEYGGFDLFVANAGVVKAGSVKEIPEKDFDFVTDVNYKGYFLCVQNAAPVLARQHKAKADYTSDIIQINSKSGLAGSNRNGAYAGSKFGGIGLTQSFALELVDDCIKVNSICPGNFFDGPLWSDPKKGLFAQYLESGKVPGAKTVEDVKHAYEKKVPMGRGCRTQDVMRAIYYIVEQQYETGQAVPVTGGQIMMN